MGTNYVNVAPAGQVNGGQGKLGRHSGPIRRVGCAGGNAVENVGGMQGQCKQAQAGKVHGTFDGDKMTAPGIEPRS